MKPWAKLWRKESGRFRARGLAARCVAAYVLKFVDEEGRIPLGRRDPATALALAMAADAGERRWLRRAVEELLEHGYLVIEGDELSVANYPRYQNDGAREPDRAPARVEPKPGANTTEPERERDRTRARVEPKPSTNATEPVHEPSTSFDSSTRDHSLARDVLFSEEEKREEKGEENASRSSARARPVALMLLDGFRERFTSEVAKLGKPVPLPIEAKGLTAGSVWQELADGLEAQHVDTLLDAAFADEFVRKSGWKPRAVLSERTRLLVEGPRSSSPRSTPTRGQAPARSSADFTHLARIAQENPNAVTIA